MAESYVTIGLLSISILELLVLQILHVSTLDVTATHLPYTRPQASCLTLPLHYRASVATRQERPIGLSWSVCRVYRRLKTSEL